MAPLGVAIIGGGIWAKKYHIPAVVESPDLELKAIYSRTLKTAQSAAASLPSGSPVPDLYSSDAGAGKSYADLLARPDVVAVITCVPIVNGPELTEEALHAGKHVLAEKPVAGDVARAKELLADYERLRRAGSGVTLSVGENFRFLEPLVYSRGEAEGLGQLTGFQGSVSMPMKTDSIWFQTEWRKRPSHQGGFVLDVGTHHVAALRNFMAQDPLNTVIAYTSQIQLHLTPIDTVHAILRTRGGATGMLSISMGLSTPGAGYSFFFDRGSIVITDWLKKVRVTRFGEDGEDGEEEEEMYEREFDTATFGVFEEVKAWGEALVGGTEDPGLGPGEALADLEVLEKMFRSGEAGGEEQKLECQ